MPQELRARKVQELCSALTVWRGAAAVPQSLRDWVATNLHLTASKKYVCVFPDGYYACGLPTIASALQRLAVTWETQAAPLPSVVGSDGACVRKP
jgi:hypothetical protein